MWAGNIGAFAEGHASLDYRLRDNEQTQEFMLNFLVALTDFINRGKCLLQALFPGESTGPYKIGFETTRYGYLHYNIPTNYI